MCLSLHCEVKQLVGVRSTRAARRAEGSHLTAEETWASPEAQFLSLPQIKNLQWLPSVQRVKSTLLSLAPTFPSSLPVRLFHALQPGGATCLSSAGQQVGEIRGTPSPGLHPVPTPRAPLGRSPGTTPTAGRWRLTLLCCCPAVRFHRLGSAHISEHGLTSALRPALSWTRRTWRGTVPSRDSQSGGDWGPHVDTDDDNPE